MYHTEKRERDIKVRDRKETTRKLSSDPSAPSAFDMTVIIPFRYLIKYACRYSNILVS